MKNTEHMSQASFKNTQVKYSYYCKSLVFHDILQFTEHLPHLMPTRNSIQYINNEVNCEMFWTLKGTWSI